MSGDAFLAVLLSSGVSAPPPKPPVRPPHVAPAKKQPAPAPPVLKLPEPPAKANRALVRPPASPVPLTVTAPREPAPARPRPPTIPAPEQIIWQLWCSGDGQLYKHSNKAYLERWVADRNSLYANARAALQARTFYESSPGYGYSAGCSTGNCGGGR
jgi:hypothetical protein